MGLLEERPRGLWDQHEREAQLEFGVGRLALDHQDLVGGGITYPDAAVGAARESVDFRAFDPPLLQHFTAGGVQPENVPAVGLRDVERAVAFVPEHPMRPGRLKVNRTQYLAGLGVEVFDAVGARATYPQRAADPWTRIQSASGSRWVKLWLILGGWRWLFARRIRSPLQPVHAALT